MSETPEQKAQREQEELNRWIASKKVQDAIDKAAKELKAQHDEIERKKKEEGK